jgi:prevent-host-death family protein
MKRRSGSRKKSAGPAHPGSAAGRRTMPASEFKTHCLRILDEVGKGQEILVTKRGEEIARVIPARRPKNKSSRGNWKGMVQVKGDIVHSDWSSDFDATR